MNGICKNCGADEGLHHYITKQCPKNGIEETRVDKLTGRNYIQQWEMTIFDDNEKTRALLIAYEQYKKANCFESDSIDVEKMLIERFIREYCQ